MATTSAQLHSEFANPNLEVLIPEAEIHRRIKELGAEIARDYAGRNPLLIGVLKGACFFLSDLLRTIDTRWRTACPDEPDTPAEQEPAITKRTGVGILAQLRIP